MSVRTCHSVFCICAFCISFTVYFVFLLLCISVFCGLPMFAVAELSMLSMSVGTRCRRVFCIEEHYTKCMCVCAHQKMEIVKIIFTNLSSARRPKSQNFQLHNKKQGDFYKILVFRIVYIQIQTRFMRCLWYLVFLMFVEKTNSGGIILDFVA